MPINGDQIPEFKRILVFAFIYEGVANWAEANGVITIKQPGGPETDKGVQVVKDLSVLIASMRSSTNLGIAQLLKNNPENRPIKVFHVGAINESHMPQGFFDDGYEVSPSPETPKYLDFLKELCEKHRIDVIIPRDSRILNQEQVALLENEGYRVMRSKNKISNLVSDKQKLAQRAREIGINAPTSIVVNNVGEFTKAVEELRQEGQEICFKPKSGLGGRGFRIIREYDELHNLLYGYQGPSITLDTAIRILSQKKSFDDLLVMNFLEGVEYSADCLCWEGKALAIVPRRKVEYAQLGSYSVQLLEDKPEIIELCKKLIEEFKLDFICNIQFRYSKGEPYLIEINRRMSGGITMASLSGVNFPYLALKLAMGEPLGEIKPVLGSLIVKQPKEMLL